MQKRRLEEKWKADHVSYGLNGSLTLDFPEAILIIFSRKDNRFSIIFHVSYCHPVATHGHSIVSNRDRDTMKSASPISR